MAVKIRLTRLGKKKHPSYRVVVMDSRKPRDGAYIEQIGRYDPRQEPSLIEIDNDRALAWLNEGAQPTERAQKLLEISGAWTRFRVAKGDIHTIEAKPEPPQPVDEAPAAEAAEEPAAEDAAAAQDGDGDAPSEDEVAAEAGGDRGDEASEAGAEAEEAT